MIKKCKARRINSPRAEHFDQGTRCEAGQSTVEYIILATAVMAVVLIAFNGPKSLFQTRMNNTFEQTSNDITSRGEKLFDSHGSDAGAYIAPTAAMGVNMQANII